jgi:hypothetical protein
MPLTSLLTPVPGRVGGSALTVLAIRGDTATEQLEVAEVHDISLAIGDIPETTTRRLVPAADFRPWPEQRVFIGGQPFVYQWVRGHATCARCNADLEHFAYSGMSECCGPSDDGRCPASDAPPYTCAGLHLVGATETDGRRVSLTVTSMQPGRCPLAVATGRGT